MKYLRHFALVALGLVCSAAFPALAQLDESAPEAADTEAHPKIVQAGPSGIMSVVAGTGYFGNYGIPGPALSADLTMPQGVAVDPKGDVYISDPEQQVVYKVTAGKIAVYAGTGVGGYSGDGGPATKAKLDLPYGLALDKAGDLYIADQRNNRIRKVTAGTGKITTVAGNGAASGPGANADCPAPHDGIAAAKASLCLPLAVAVDSKGDLYIDDWSDNEIRKVTATSGLISTVAGAYGRNGYSGDGGLAVNAALNFPEWMAIDPVGNIYIADTLNCAVRKVTAATAVISTVLGSPGSGCPGVPSLSGTPASSAAMGRPHAIAVDAAGNIVVTDKTYGLVYLIDAKKENFYTIAGINLPSSNPYANLLPEVTLNAGPGAYQLLTQASGVTIDTNKTSPTYGDVIFADAMDGLVYKIAQGTAPQTDIPSVTTALVSGSSGPEQVTITAPIAGSAIYYTLNGKMPTTTSTRYSKPFTLKTSAVITAFAVRAGVNSQASIDAIVENSAPVFSATSVSAPGATTPVTMTVPVTGGTIYYTTDGSDPTAGGPTVKKYTATITAKYQENLQAAYLPPPVTDFAGNVWQQWSPITQATFPIELP